MFSRFRANISKIEPVSAQDFNVLGPTSRHVQFKAMLSDTCFFEVDVSGQ